MADEIIDLLGLTKCAHVRIGSETVRGISGGEKKRVAVALGLIAHPRVVLLDEPTTGLDSTTALDFVNAMRRLAARDATLLCTIHQPTEEIFNLFDKILVIGDGRRVYAGPPGGALE
ncbi:hypothetical protein AURANDRAFT_19424, partial [Aureococcus anophagefferens]